MVRKEELDSIKAKMGESCVYNHADKEESVSNTEKGMKDQAQSPPLDSRLVSFLLPLCFFLQLRSAFSYSKVEQQTRT
jgi:hypothetical protein